MKHPFLLGACVLLGALVPWAIVACGLDVSGLEGSGVDASEASMLDTGLPDTRQADTGVKDSAVADAGDSGTSESGMPEASCTGVTCNGSCIAASDCRSCSGAPLLCAATEQCVSDCRGCNDANDAGMPIECFACDSNHANPIGTCQYDDAGSYCLNGDYLGQYQGGSGYQCSCTDAGVGACPGATQVCVPLGNRGESFCLTCGEPTIGVIQGQPCRAGGTCQESQAACQ